MPMAASRIPASEFVAIRSAEPLASGQASISADPQPRTPASEALGSARSGDDPRGPGSTPGGGPTPNPSPAASPSATVAPSAPRLVSVAPVRVPTASKTGRPVPATHAGKFGVVVGTASWFRSPAGVSAAGPALRRAIGPNWRGSRVRVTGPAGSAVTTLGDWMAADRLIDLDDGVFPAVCGPLSRGICEAKVTW